MFTFYCSINLPVIHILFLKGCTAQWLIIVIALNVGNAHALKDLHLLFGLYAFDADICADGFSHIDH